MNHPGLWQYYQLRSDNKGLTSEQLRQKYLKEHLLYEEYIHYQVQQQIVVTSPTSGGASKLPLLEVSNCIQFAVNTTTSINMQIDIESNGPTEYTINWGDGVEETGTIDGLFDLDHTYPDPDTVYTANLCFTNPSAIIVLDFPGFD